MPDDKVIPVRVALRCRPLIPKEEAEGCQCCIKFVNGEPQVILGKEKAFTYDYVFSADTPQIEVYEQAVAGLVQGIFKGYNATVLAYGQTGSGKTFSMGGSYGCCTDPNDDMNGVIPRVIRQLYEGVDERSEEYDFTIKVSYIELYKEDLIDLLSPLNKRDKDAIQIREENNGGIKLVGLIEQEVHSLDETLLCLDNGSKSRTTGATAMNSTSSRSHAIFTILVEKKSKTQENDLCCAKFHLVDLAGSERVKKTQAEGERFKEGVNINKGLLALGNVISALGDEAQKRTHIPYRDSKLTRLLQDSLGGNSHTVMVACISPADSNMEETLSTLRYADRARKIKNKPVVNRDPQQLEILRLRQLVQSLQVQMVGGGKVPNMLSITNSTLSDTSVDNKELKQKCDELETEKTKLSRELRTHMAQNTVLMEQNIHLEMRNEKLSNTLDIVKHKTGLMGKMSMSRLETTVSIGETGDSEETIGEQTDENPMSLIKAIHARINEAEKDQKFTMTTILEDGESTSLGTPTGNDSITDEEQLSKQADFQRRLAELNDHLYEKETVVQQMLQNGEAMDEMKAKYEKDKTDLMKQIDKLNGERENLVHELDSAKSNVNSNKIAEQRRKRLKELEEQLGQCRKTLKEQSRVVKLKEQSDQQLKKMQQDITDMKQRRVKLVKQMKEEAEHFRKFKQQKDKEVMQLKAKDRKRQIELVKMQRTNEQQQLVLRRKAEEASAANKRLKDALLKQRAVQDERNKKQEANDMSGIGARVRKWLSHELEVLVSVEDAKRHLEGLKHDRADFVKQKKTLTEKLENGPSPAKRKMSNDGTADESVTEEKIRQDINLVQAEVDLRSAQISDLQEKVMDAGQDDKNKSRWQNIHTMVEAKCAMKHLLNEAVNARLDESKEKTKLVESQEHTQEAVVSIDELKKNNKEMRQKQAEEVLNIQKTYENKMLFLMNQLKNSSSLDSTQDEELRKRLIFQEQQIEKLMKFQEELERKTAECELLKKELTRANYNITLGRDGTLMPDIGANGLPASTKQRLESQEDSRFFSPVFTKKKRTTARPKITEMDDYSDEEEDEDDDEPEEAEDVEDVESDPDWMMGQTPGVVRTSRATKRKVAHQTMTFKRPSGSTTPKDASEFDEIPNLSTGCECKNKCIRTCPCKLKSSLCDGDGCGCNVLICTNRKKDSLPEEDEESVVVNSTSSMNATFNVGGNTSTPMSSFSTSQSDATAEIFVKPKLKENVPRLEKKHSSDIKTKKPTTLLKENTVESGDLLQNGGVKKKRKLQNAGKSFFPHIKS